MEKLIVPKNYFDKEGKPVEELKLPAEIKVVDFKTGNKIGTAKPFIKDGALWANAITIDKDVELVDPCYPSIATEWKLKDIGFPIVDKELDELAEALAKDDIEGAAEESKEEPKEEK